MASRNGTFPIFHIDAFAERPFTGNPAAVCLLIEFFADEILQQIASEMNLSETAFVVRRGDQFDLRWFTPTVEVDLCGHATLAAAHALWESGVWNGTTPALFTTRSGRLEAIRVGDEIRLDFPATPVALCEPPAGLVEALGVRPLFVGANRFDYLVQVATAQEVRDVAVDLGGLRQLGVRGVILTAPADSPDLDFISRFFAPGAGIDEDPVTGSAHCALGPFWQSRLPRTNSAGLTEFRAYQASPRGGRLRVVLDGDRVHLIGRAITVFRGEFQAC
jgi:predicted PhzF superfamily epimerase YddE/YHI9